MAPTARLNSLSHLADEEKQVLAIRISERCRHSGTCLIWTGAKRSAHGYGAIKVRGKVEITHRVAYMLMIGDIPNGDVLDHVVCDNNRCVNPDHVVPKSHQANMARGNCPSALNARKTHCHKGHPLSGSNLCIRANQKRGCRTCKREWQTQWRKTHPRDYPRENRRRTEGQGFEP